MHANFCVFPAYCFLPFGSFSFSFSLLALLCSGLVVWLLLCLVNLLLFTGHQLYSFITVQTVSSGAIHPIDLITTQSTGSGATNAIFSAICSHIQLVDIFVWFFKMINCIHVSALSDYINAVPITSDTCNGVQACKRISDINFIGVKTQRYWHKQHIQTRKQTTT